MFCPSSADWGNVADWVSGVGSMGAVIVALGIAIRDSRQKQAADKARELRAAQDENAMIVEALELYRELRSWSQRALDAFEGEGEALDWRGMIEVGRAVGATARRLQQLPLVNIRMYREYESIIQLARDMSSLNIERKADDLVAKLRVISNSADFRYTHLLETPNPGAPLNW